MILYHHELGTIAGTSAYDRRVGKHFTPFDVHHYHQLVDRQLIAVTQIPHCCHGRRARTSHASETGCLHPILPAKQR